MNEVAHRGNDLLHTRAFNAPCGRSRCATNSKRVERHARRPGKKKPCRGRPRGHYEVIEGGRFIEVVAYRGGLVSSRLALTADAFNLAGARDQAVPALTGAVEHRIQKLYAALSDHLLGPFIEQTIVTAAGGHAHRLEGAARLLAA
jgi:hypothetical protein